MAEPSASNYPSALDNTTSLGGDAVNLTQLTLDADINAIVATVSVTESIVGINTPCYLLVESELIYAPSTSGGDFVTCVRGAGGTTAASHVSGTVAYIVYAANLFNQLKRAIIAVETEMGIAPKSIDQTVAAGASPASVAEYLDMVAYVLKSLKNTANWYTALTGTPSISTFLRGDGSWAAGGIGSGWTDGPGTWSYSSADAPTFIISINADVTALIGLGYRIKLTQTTDKYFIVTAVGAFAGGATLVTVYGGTDYTLANAAITSPFYSPIKAPFGFPLDPTKWTVAFSDTTQRSQASPTQNTWYNPGSLSMSIPIGLWKVRYSLLPYGYRLGTANAVQLQISLSTSNNSVSDATLSAAEYAGLLSSNAELALSLNKARPLPLALAAKATYYFIIRTISTNIGSISFENATETLYGLAECAYL